MCRSPENFYFSFFSVESLSMPECFYVNTAVFELATEMSNVASVVSACADQPLQTKSRQFFRIKCTIAEHNLKHAKWTKGLQKLVRWFLDADDNLDSHRNPIILFWPIYNAPRNLYAKFFRVICIKSANWQAKSMRKQVISFVQVIKFL